MSVVNVLGNKSSFLKRNDTDFPMKASVKLQELYSMYTNAQKNTADPEHKWVNMLKYYQYLVKTIMTNPEFGIGSDGNARGLLVYHTMGMGKTRLTVAIMMAMLDVRQVIILLARSLQDNFQETINTVIDLLNIGASPEEIKHIRANVATKFSFVSMDAYNSATQMARAGSQEQSKDISGIIGGLDGKLLIVDEAHNFFRSIINTSAENSNARRIYDMIMVARNLRLIFLTGTPAAKDPFELVPCFNMLAGVDLLPTQYEIFYKLYVDREKHTVHNREKLSNRLVGLVSHVTHTKATSSVAIAKARDDGWFPEQLPTIIEKIEMGAYQYRQYLLARETEDAEGKTGDSKKTSGVNVMSTPVLSLPGSEQKAMRSYYVKSRMLSIFCPPREWATKSVEEMPDSVFIAENAPKLAFVAARIDKARGPVLVYSQFVESGLKPLGRFLQLLGYKPFIIDSSEKDLSIGGSEKDLIFGSSEKDLIIVQKPCLFTNKTYKIFCEDCGMDHKWVKSELDRCGFKLSDTTIVSFAWGELSHVNDRNYYDPAFTKQAAELKSILNDGKRAITDKTQLIKTLGPQSFIPNTRLLSTVDEIIPGEVIILKKANSFGTRGVVVVSDTSELEAYKKIFGIDGIACTYIQNPMLCNGYKFHLRIHLIVYISGGIARASVYPIYQILPARSKYKASNWSDSSIHMSGTAGLVEYYSWPESLKLDDSVLKLAETTLKESLTTIAIAIAQNVEPYPESYAAFEVFGLDVMFDETGQTWILEVNDRVGLEWDLSTGFSNKELYSANFFQWVLSECVLPHFGLAIPSKVLWIGESMKDGPLSPYVKIIASLLLQPLENATISQLKDLSRIASIPEIYISIGKGTPWSFNKIKDMQKTSIEDSTNTHSCRQYYHWIIIYRELVVGYVGLRPTMRREDEPSSQLRIFVDPAHQKGGIATATIAAVMEIYAALLPNNPIVWSNISPNNAASIRIHEKLKFIKHGMEMINGKQYIVYKRPARLESLNLKSEDNFPYRKLYMPPFVEMVKKLRMIAESPPEAWSKPQLGRIALVERSFPKDYETADSLSDWDAEPVRIQCKERAVIDSPQDAWNVIRNDHDLPDDIRKRRELVYNKSRGCNLFNVALGVYELNGANNWIGLGAGDVLDPAAGWGDRLGAAFIVGARSYNGWDTNTKLQPVYAALAARYESAGFKLKWKIKATPFEQVPDEEIAKKYDTVIMSPPFYDIELYEGDKTSTKMYSSANEWYEKFYRVLLRKVAIALRDGGRIIAYIPSGRMKEEAMNILQPLGFTYIGAVGFRQTKNNKESPGPIRDSFVWIRTTVRKSIVRKSIVKKGGVNTWQHRTFEENQTSELMHNAELFLASQSATATQLEAVPHRGYYAIISGEVTSDHRAAIVKANNSLKNKHGEVIKALLVSKTGAEGLDLKWLCETIQVEPYWDKARDEQVIARAVRLGSHDILPVNEREVQPVLCIAVANQSVFQQMLQRDRELKSIDETFYDRANERYETNNAFRQLLVEICYECELFGYGNCYTCIPTNSLLFHDDPSLDIRLANPCEIRRETDVEVSSLEIKGVTYYYREDKLNPFGYNIYIYREDLGGYSTIDSTNPIISLVLSEIASKAK